MADNTKELNLSEVEQVSGGMGDNGCYQVINSITGAQGSFINGEVRDL